MHANSSSGPLTRALVWDANGNLARQCSGSGVTRSASACSGSDVAIYGYDPLARLAQANLSGSQTLSEAYGYDPQGRRISKTSNGALTQYRYAGDALYADYGPSLSTPRTLYLQGAGTDEPLLAIDPANAANRRYDSFGRVLASSGSLPTYGYSGREPDASGLVYYRARYYAPELGRFTQADPIGLAGGINRYAYVGGSPVNFRDPSGLMGVGSVNPHIGGGSGGKGPSGASSLSAYAGAAWDSVVSTVQAIGWKDAVHMGVDVAATSETPVVSQAAGLVSALWYGLEGDQVGAGTSLLGMVPMVGAVGDAGRMGRWVKRVEEAGEAAARGVKAGDAGAFGLLKGVKGDGLTHVFTHKSATC